MIGFQTGNPLSILDELRTLAAPATTFFSGGKFADRSQAMDQNLKDTIMSQYDKTGIMSGNIGYSDFDKSQTPGTPFPDLPLMSSNLFSGKISPAQFSNATTAGRLSYDIDPNTGKVNFGSNAYNFRPEMATIDPSDPYGQQAFSYFAGKANERNREINPDISIPVDYLRGFGRDFSQLGDVDSFRSRMERMNERPSENTLQATQRRQASSPRALGAEFIPEKEKGIFSLGDIVADLGRKGVEGFKDVAGRSIASQALGGAGGMLLGPLGALLGGIFGAFKGGDLFQGSHPSIAAIAQRGNPEGLQMRRDATSISRMLNRKAKGKGYGANRLNDIFGKFGFNVKDKTRADYVDIDGMSDSIAQSAQTGYGGYGSSGAAAAAAATGGRDYSNSPGAMAGDMEYDEE